MATFFFNSIYSANYTGPGNSRKVTPSGTDLSATNNVSILESTDNTSLAINEPVTITFPGSTLPTTLYFKGFAGTGTNVSLVFSTSTDVTSGTFYVASNNTTLPSTEFDYSANSGYTCFVAGTLITTASGQRPIEQLAIGDLIVTDDGLQAVKFLSQNNVHPMLLHWAQALPIRISANAFGEVGPARDLLVTPGHAILIDGHLVHASVLVNGTTIVQTTIEDWSDKEQISYFNIEMETHRLIQAEGLEVESYFDILPRKLWDNYSEYMAIYGEELPMEELSLPRVEFTRQLPKSLIHSLGSDIRELVAV